MAEATEAPARKTHRERTEITRRALVEAARELFARDGYAATPVEEVVAACGVTKGALYHHFVGKRELFEAVFEAEERRLCEAIATAYGKRRDPAEGAYVGMRAFLAEMVDPGVRQIMLLDAPSVLGWRRIREIEANYPLALIKEAVREAIEGGQIRKRDVDTFSHLLYGALCEASLLVAEAENPSLAKRRAERELKAFFDALAAY